MDEMNDRIMADLGPVYYETNLDRFIVEPFNAFSSLAMSLSAVFIWLFLLKGDFRKYPFIAYVFTPLIFLGGIGSTLFHAFRTSQFFLLMDWLPILLLTILLSLFYWYKLYPKVYFIVLMTLFIFTARILPALFLEGSAVINVSYFVSGVLIIVPLFIYMMQGGFKFWGYILISVITLLIALYFRYADDLESQFLPMGTHWLWHVFSGIGAWFLGVYIFKAETFAKR